MHSEYQVALYIRVSTEEQTEGHSLAAQEALLKNEAKQRGWLVYKVYQDAGISGVREDRKGLNDLLRDAKRGCFQTVLTWAVSRISRKLSYLLSVIEELKRLNIAFYSVSEQFDLTTPVGQFALTMMGAVAQMQREAWMEASRLGMEKRAQAGRWGGGMMLGYKMQPDADDPRGGSKLVIVPEEANTVKKIFALYADGLGYKAIVNTLNKAGRRGKTGRMFTIDTVRGILSNAVYVGKTRFNDQYYDGIHEPIIDLKLWEVVQRTRHNSSKAVKKIISREYLLSGILKCPACGSGMVPTHTTLRRRDGSYNYIHYYVCNRYLNKGSAACKANSVRADKVEQKVMLWLERFLTSPFWLRCITEKIKQVQTAKNNSFQTGKKQAQQGLGDIAKRQGALLRRYEDGLIDKEKFIVGMQQLKGDKERWQEILDKELTATTSEPCWSAEDVKAAFQAFRKVLANADIAQKKQLLRSLLTKIQVSADRNSLTLDLRLIQLATTEDEEVMSAKIAI